MSYLRENLRSIDQTANTLLWGKCNETLSSRAWRCGYRDTTPKRRWKVARVFIDCLFFLDIDHCKSAYEKELERNLSYNDRQGAEL